MEHIRTVFLTAGSIVLAFLILLTLIRAILGPRFTDRVVAINVINTIVVAIISILSVLTGEEFLVDVALVYALLSFLTIVVLSRLVLTWRHGKAAKDRREGGKGGTEIG